MKHLKNKSEVNIKNPNDFMSRDEGIQKQIGFMSWIQEFTKKIVSITFIIFILSNVFYLVMLLAQFSTSASITYIDTFITEMHQTFRDVIGGYIVKAAAENVIKIGGGYLIRYMEAKAKVDVERMRMTYKDLQKEKEEETYFPEEDTSEVEYYDENFEDNDDIEAIAE